jgi:hypothetical protein
LGDAQAAQYSLDLGEKRRFRVSHGSPVYTPVRMISW